MNCRAMTRPPACCFQQYTVRPIVRPLNHLSQLVSQSPRRRSPMGGRGGVGRRGEAGRTLRAFRRDIDRPARPAPTLRPDPTRDERNPMVEPRRNIIEGRPVLVVIDIQGGDCADDEPSTMPFMAGYGDRMDRAPALVAKATSTTTSAASSRTAWPDPASKPTRRPFGRWNICRPALAAPPARSWPLSKPGGSHRKVPSQSRPCDDERGGPLHLLGTPETAGFQGNDPAPNREQSRNYKLFLD